MRKHNIFLLVLACMVWILAGCGDSGDTATHFVTGTPWPTPTPTNPVQRDITLSVLDGEGAAFIGATVVITGSTSFTQGPVDESGVLPLSAIPEGSYTVTAPGFSETSAELTVAAGTDAYEVRLARLTAANPRFVLYAERPDVKDVAEDIVIITDDDGLELALYPMQGASANEAVYPLSYENDAWTAASVPAGAYRIGEIGYDDRTVKSSKADPRYYNALTGIVTVTSDPAVLSIEIFEALEYTYIRIVKGGAPLTPDDVDAVTLGGLPYNDYDNSEKFTEFEFEYNTVMGAFNLFVQLKDGSSYLIPLQLSEDEDQNNLEIDLDRLLNHRPLFSFTAGGKTVSSGEVYLYPIMEELVDGFKIEQVCPLVYSGGSWQVKGMIMSGNYRAVYMSENEEEPVFSSETFKIDAATGSYSLALNPCYFVGLALSVNGTFITWTEWEDNDITIKLDEHFALTAYELEGTDYFFFEGILGGSRPVTVTAVKDGETFTYTGSVNISGDNYDDFTASVELEGDKPWPFED